MPLRSLLNQLSDQAHAWILSQRDLHWPHARALSAPERRPLRGFYASDLLDSVRVRAGHAIENPQFYWQAIAALQHLGVRTEFSLALAAGITFVDCVVLPQPAFTADLLFHEAVHVVQYRLLGPRRFAERYVNGLADAGFVYERNPMEAVAFELQERFLLGLRFDVQAIIERDLRQ